MGLVTDILKEIPQAVVLKEKLSTIEAKYAAADTENAVLKDDLRHAKAEITNLKKQIAELSRTDLDETDKLILREVALAEPAESATAGRVAQVLGLNPVMVELRLRRLSDTDYLEAFSIGGPDYFILQPKSTDYLVKNNLIS
jgi:Fic family protein